MADAGRDSFPYLQGVLAFLIVASWAHFKTVVAPGSLPKSAQGGRRSSDLPTRLLGCALGGQHGHSGFSAVPLRATNGRVRPRADVAKKLRIPSRCLCRRLRAQLMVERSRRPIRPCRPVWQPSVRRCRSVRSIRRARLLRNPVARPHRCDVQLCGRPGNLQPRPPQESLPAAQPSSLPGAAGQSAPASEVHRPSLLPLSHSQRRPANLEPADWEIALRTMVQHRVEVRC
jgi:hypothetical protein